MTLRLCFACSPRSSCRISTRTEASSMETGSSATISFGSRIIPRAAARGGPGPPDHGNRFAAMQVEAHPVHRVDVAHPDEAPAAEFEPRVQPADGEEDLVAHSLAHAYSQHFTRRSSPTLSRGGSSLHRENRAGHRSAKRQPLGGSSR